MLFFYENMPENEAISMIDNEKSSLEYISKFYNRKRQTLLIYMQKITDSIQKIDDTNRCTSLFEILAKLKELSQKMEIISLNHKKLCDDLKALKFGEETFAEKINEYNSTKKTFKTDLTNFLVGAEEFIHTALENCDFQFRDAEDEKAALIAEETPAPVEETTVEAQSNVYLADNNCLLISETKGKVFLPYKINELREQFEAKTSKYASLSEMIEQEYILPITQFKNSMLARFKATFELMRKKEKASLFEALDFALELSFVSTLNPAIIVACKNKFELDVYLACLHEEKLENFKIFDIKYESCPILR